MNNRLVV